MDQVNFLRRHGLFDAKIPRYTSYPPANRFEPGVGQRVQSNWLGNVETSKPISTYVHIPFCRRLCWFCACRTQGTQTLKPVESYVDTLLTEIDLVTREHLPQKLSMARLHLGGGTPTLLNAKLMDRLLSHLYGAFDCSEGFEFSVEIDPTDASSDVLRELFRWKMARASVGVQDFEPKVQQAIGRCQSFEITRDIVRELRRGGVASLNIDLLYGLPFQSVESLIRTLDQVVSLGPDRLALYGYAHVPHVSKRQVMIATETLPSPERRFEMSQIAKERLIAFGYVPIGLDHFALPHDSLAKAARTNQMTRNFQGYTDDPCETLLGFGASAISKFQQGFVQNAVATSAYQQRIQSDGLAGHKGYRLSSEDVFVAALIDGIMCNGTIQTAAVLDRFSGSAEELNEITDDLLSVFPELLLADEQGLSLRLEMAAAARLISAHLDTSRQQDHIHSLAV